MNKGVFFSKGNFYGSVILNTSTLAEFAMSPKVWDEILSFHDFLATDEYVAYLDEFYRECRRRFGEQWRYLDIVNVLYAASRVLQPENYLEIGVRRGRSLCSVVRGCPSVNIVALDMWITNYADMDNPGPQFVLSELEKHNIKGKVDFINGNSHITVPEYFKNHPQMQFDMITVDGDHSEQGAFEDLCNVIPYLAPGGVLVFDDISHPVHPYLLDVWKSALAKFPYLSGYEFTEMGYGVAFAIRRA